MVGGDFIKEFLGMMRTPLDWGLAGTASLLGAGTDAYFNVLTPVFFDPTMTGGAALVAALSMRAFWKHARAGAQSRKDCSILIPYLEGEIETVSDEGVKKAFATDLKLADSDPDKLAALRTRIETYLVMQIQRGFDNERSMAIAEGI